MELIPDFTKSLVWQKDFEALKNQYFIAQQQFSMLELLDGQAHYLVTECALPQLPDGPRHPRHARQRASAVYGAGGGD